MLYLVYVNVDRGVADDWETWMRDVHVPDLIATGCFSRAYMLRDEEGDTDERLAFRCGYFAKSAADLDRYQAEFAPALKADHMNRYAGKVEARREILPVLGTFSPT